MQVLVTGANGFIAKNFIETIKNDDYNVLKCTRSSTDEELEEYCKQADIVYHLAGVNRPENEADFEEGNVKFTQKLIMLLEKNYNCCPIVFSSSIQAMHDNLYGKSKLKAESIIKEYARRNSTASYIFRLPNVFGKWCKPNYNSVVATFCYNIAREYPIHIDDRNAEIRLVYIDDVVEKMCAILKEKKDEQKLIYMRVTPEFRTTVGELAWKLNRIYENRKMGYLSVTKKDSLSKYLYSTYLSYIPNDDLSYIPKMNIDSRGSFTELFKTDAYGQVSVNISRPGITKGNHWHKTKNEKFVVVSGTGVIQLRKIDDTEIIEYDVSGEKMKIIDIPPGYTHNIINQGDHDMITIMWCNECYDQSHPDTYQLDV